MSATTAPTIRSILHDPDAGDQKYWATTSASSRSMRRVCSDCLDLHADVVDNFRRASYLFSKDLLSLPSKPNAAY
jgi:hypothetical protein